MKKMLRITLLICTISLINCKKDPQVINCPETNDLGIIKPISEIKDLVPYEYELGKRLVFKNSNGEEIIFYPRSTEVGKRTSFASESIDCQSVDGFIVNYEIEEYGYGYGSNKNIKLIITLSPKKFYNEENEFDFYDNLNIFIYNLSYQNNNPEFLLDHRINIPLVTHSGSEGEYSWLNLFTDFVEDISFQDKDFSEVYLTNNRENPDIGYSFSEGLITFIDENNERWVFDGEYDFSSETAYNFSLPDTSDNLVKLSQVPGELILIDFWASWCVPCRTETEEILKPLYEEFADKGLNIISVSIDTDKNDWIEAIIEDDTDWIHVNDVNGYASEVFTYYDIFSIPTICVVDENQNIHSKNLRGEELIEFVTQYFN